MVKTYGMVDVTPEQMAYITGMWKEFEALEEKINDIVPPGRLRSIALTKLEETSMFVVKAISRGANQ